MRMSTGRTDRPKSKFKPADLGPLRTWLAAVFRRLATKIAPDSPSPLLHEPLNNVRSGPPDHWLAKVRQGAPDLLIPPQEGGPEIHQQAPAALPAFPPIPPMPRQTRREQAAMTATPSHNKPAPQKTPAATSTTATTRTLAEIAGSSNDSKSTPTTSALPTLTPALTRQRTDYHSTDHYLDQHPHPRPTPQPTSKTELSPAPSKTPHHTEAPLQRPSKHAVTTHTTPERKSATTPVPPSPSQSTAKRRDTQTSTNRQPLQAGHQLHPDFAPLNKVPKEAFFPETPSIKPASFTRQSPAGPTSIPPSIQPPKAGPVHHVHATHPTPASSIHYEAILPQLTPLATPHAKSFDPTFPEFAGLWPELPDQPSADDETWVHLISEQAHLQRLDAEQRGNS